MKIPFNKPYMTGKELWYISQAHHNGQLSGDGPFTKKCEAILAGRKKVKKTLLTHSCTAALEMAAMLADIQPGDEIIMPSYTFVSTANAFVLRGGIPVFVDIRPDTLNIDETKIEAAITSRTKAIVPVHYAGVGCQMQAIMQIAERHNLIVIEDAAQAIRSRFNGQPLGSFGHMAALSFHETKNITSGEGGALLIRDERFVERAEILREKGTNRKQFFRGQVDKYTWVDIGSSFLPGEVVAAFLYAQLEEVDSITEKRLHIWQRYYEKLAGLEQQGNLKRAALAENIQHNAHMFYILLANMQERDALMQYLREQEIVAVFHYIPLHSSPAGQKYGRVSGSLSVTDDISGRLLRLPMYADLSEENIDRIVAVIGSFFQKTSTT